jgi:hypothetical protein
MNQPQDDRKATAILAGFLRQHVASNATESAFRETAWEFARLLASVTSADAEVRDIAKKRVRELAKGGGWTVTREPLAIPAGQGFPSDNQIQVEPTHKRRAGTWSKEQNKAICQQWAASKCDADSIRSISSASGRSPLAIIIRLHRLGLLHLDHGDELCLQVQAPKLLSEVEITASI